MPDGALIGFVVTGVTLAAFLWWTSHELRRMGRDTDASGDPDTSPERDGTAEP